MWKQIAFDVSNTPNKYIFILSRWCCSNKEIAVPKSSIPDINYQVINTSSLPSDDYVDTTLERQSLLEECKEDISHIAPFLKPTFNFAAYINKSETLQELLKLGVNLNKLEKNTDVPPFILSLKFEENIKPYIIFLYDLGLSVEDIGQLITKNPFIFRVDMDDLNVRINYLKAKKFDDAMIQRILSKNPYWLSFR